MWTHTRGWDPLEQSAWDPVEESSGTGLLCQQFGARLISRGRQPSPKRPPWTREARPRPLPCGALPNPHARRTPALTILVKSSTDGPAFDFLDPLEEGGSPCSCAANTRHGIHTGFRV